MLRKIKKKCCVCGKEYEILCPECTEAASQPTWMNSFCSDNCRKIYDAAAGYYGEAYSAQQARSLLDMCDLSEKEHFTTSTQNLIKEIYEKTTVKQEVTQEAKTNVKPQFNNNNKKFKKNK